MNEINNTLVPEIVDDSPSEKQVALKRAEEVQFQLVELKEDIRAIKEDKDLSDFVTRNIEKNVKRAEDFLDTFEDWATRGEIDDKGMLAIAYILNSVNNAVEQINKLKVQREELQIKKTKLMIEAMKRKEAMQTGTVNVSNSQVLITREDLLRQVDGDD